MTVVIVVDSVVRLTAESTTSSQSVIIVVRHVAVAVSKTWKIDAGPAALAGDLSGDTHADVCTDQTCGKCSPGYGVRWACMNVE